MAIEPGAESSRSPSPDPSTGVPRAPRKRPWVSAVIGLVVLGLIVLIVFEAKHYLNPPQSAATSRPTASSRPSPKPFIIEGTVSRPGDAGGSVSVVVVQPAWTSEQQQEWEKRVNEKVAKAWQETGADGEAPPKVSADPASVRRADEAIARRYQAAKSATPWKHQCTTEFLALLKESGVEAGRATAAPDGTFSMQVAPPAGMPYIVHGTGGNADWIDTLRRGSNRVDLNDSNRVPD